MCDHHLFLIVLPNDWSSAHNFEDNKPGQNPNLCEPKDGETPQCERIAPIIIEPTPSRSTSLCQLLKSAILDKYGLNEHAMWISSSNRKHFQVTFVSEIGTLCEELLHRLSEIGIGRLPDTRVTVVPLTCAIGYDAPTSAATISSGKFSTLPKPSFKETVDYSSKFPSIDPKLSSTIPQGRRPSQRRKSIRADFMQSIRSRLMVFQVVQAIRSQSAITFDFLVLLTIASVLAALGLLENSSVILVASMLISPLMGPILAMVFGLCIHDRSLWRAGLRSEFFGLFVCLVCGIFIGFGTSIWETNWGSSTSFPTPEMKARGDLTRLSVGSMIALPSGAGVALSVLGGNAGSLVGVAISASLLPPAVNSGVLLAYSLLTAVAPGSFGRHSNGTYIFQRKIYPKTELLCHEFLSNDYHSLYSCNMSTETFILAIASFLLTLVNIICIVSCALVVLRIKEVAPLGVSDVQDGSEADRFFHQDMRRFRDYQKTINTTQELNDDNKTTMSNSFQDGSDSKRERRKQLLALASLHDLDLSNQNDITLNNAAARGKVKQLYKTMVQFDKDAKRLDIGLQNKRTLPTLMMDVLPPKWTELFQHQEDQELSDGHVDDDQVSESTEQSQWRHGTQYNTYHNCCTIHTMSQRPSSNFSKHRTKSCTSDKTELEPLFFVNKEGETQLYGTRFRLTKATIPIDDQEENQHQQLNENYP